MTSNKQKLVIGIILIGIFLTILPIGTANAVVSNHKTPIHKTPIQTIQPGFAIAWINGVAISNHNFTNGQIYGIYAGNEDICGIGTYGESVKITGIQTNQVSVNVGGNDRWCIGVPQTLSSVVYHITATQSNGQSDSITMSFIRNPNQTYPEIPLPTGFAIAWINGVAISNHNFTNGQIYGIYAGNGLIGGVGHVGDKVIITGIPLYPAPYNTAVVDKNQHWEIPFPDARSGVTYHITAHESDGKTDTLTLLLH